MTASIIKNLKKFARTVVVLAFWVTVWHLIAVKVDLEVIVPKPLQVFERLAELLSQKEYYSIILNSILNILSGFSAAVLAGTVLGILTAKIPILNAFLSPLLSIVKATPVASFILLALFWLSTDDLPSFIAFLLVIPIIHGNVSEGLKNTSVELVEMTRTFNFSLKHKLTKLYFPSIFPYFVAGFKTSLGLAWKAGVAAEVLAVTKNSIGRQLYYGKMNLESIEVYAWTITIIVLSVILEYLLLLAVKALTRRKREAISK